MPKDMKNRLIEENLKRQRAFNSEESLEFYRYFEPWILKRNFRKEKAYDQRTKTLLDRSREASM